MTTNETPKTDSDNGTPGYPVYPAKDDIYAKEKKVTDVDAEGNTISPMDDAPQSNWNEEDYDTTVSGEDLDVPGSELDDKQEAVGNEDEENNYYSLGDND